ncbi:MAG: hypothetical protein R8G34_03765 [Paracoccaceae bacterium]|nr:hypothetical protein [Paracoccaceae bacterium]
MSQPPKYGPLVLGAALSEGGYNISFGVGTNQRVWHAMLLDTGSSATAFLGSAYSPGADTGRTTTRFSQRVNYVQAPSWQGSVVKTQISVFGWDTTTKQNTEVPLQHANVAIICEPGDYFDGASGILALGPMKEDEATQHEYPTYQADPQFGCFIAHNPVISGQEKITPYFTQLVAENFEFDQFAFGAERSRPRADGQYGKGVLILGGGLGLTNKFISVDTVGLSGYEVNVQAYSIGRQFLNNGQTPALFDIGSNKVTLPISQDAMIDAFNSHNTTCGKIVSRYFADEQITDAEVAAADWPLLSYQLGNPQGQSWNMSLTHKQYWQSSTKSAGQGYSNLVLAAEQGTISFGLPVFCAYFIVFDRSSASITVASPYYNFAQPALPDTLWDCQPS